MDFNPFVSIGLQLNASTRLSIQKFSLFDALCIITICNSPVTITDGDVHRNNLHEQEHLVELLKNI